MGKFNLRDFVRAMKKGNRTQISGYLFALDKKTGDLCGCALGQGLLNSGYLNEDEIRAELKSDGSPASVRIIESDGKVLERPMLVKGDLESAWMQRLNDDLGSDFTAAVVGENDPGNPMSRVIDMVFAKFGDRLA